MTFREETHLYLRRIRRQLFWPKRALGLLVFLTLFSLAWEILHLPPASPESRAGKLFFTLLNVAVFANAVLLFGGMVTLFKFKMAAKRPCMHCQKNLGYLLSDVNYSKCKPWEVPDDFPEGIDACPFCDMSFDLEMPSHLITERVS